MDNAKLVQCVRLVPAFLALPGQVQRLASVLPGLLTASSQTTDLAEPCDPAGRMCAHADSFPDRLLHQRAPSARRPLERIGITQGPP